MQAVKLQGIITSLSDRQDNSLRLSISTPEMTNDELGVIRQLKNMPLDILIKSSDYNVTDIKEVKSELDEKSPSQRLRNTLYVYWKQNMQDEPFDFFYKRKMDNIINTIKDRLEPK